MDPSAIILRARAVISRSTVVPIVAVNASVLGLGLLTSVQTARWLGPLGRGEIAAAMLWPTLIGFIASTGLVHATLFHAARLKSNIGDVVGTALMLGLGQGILAVAIGWFAIPLLLGTNAGLTHISRTYLLITPVILLTQYSSSAVQALQAFRVHSALRLLVPAGYFAGVVLMNELGVLTPTHVIFLLIGLQVGAFCLATVALAQLSLIHRLSFSRGTAKALLGFGVKVQAGDFAQAANLRMDQALISALFPLQELGIYVAAVSAANVVDVLAQAVRLVLTPRLAAMGAVEEKRTLLRTTLRTYSVVAAIVMLAYAVPIRWLLPIVFGPNYSAAIVPALVLIPGMFALGAKSILAGGAQAFDDPWLSSRTELYGALVTAAGLVVLLPRFGVLGAALATTLSYFAQAVVVSIGFRARHGLRLLGA